MTGVLPPLPKGTVVTVGTFDGVHLGHRAVLEEIVGKGAIAEGRRIVERVSAPTELKRGLLPRAPIDAAGWSSKTGSHCTPPSVDLNTPPDAAPI